MRYKKRSEIIDFFDVSIVMPFYEKLNDFKKVLPKNAQYFQRNGIEIVIVLNDSNEEKDLLKFIKKYPFINFKILINRKSHQKYNYGKVLNVGIRAASFDYILILNPKVELINDIIYKLRYVMSFYPKTFVSGINTSINYNDTNSDLTKKWEFNESIMVKKSDLLSIKGYNENFEDCIVQNEQVSRRLELSGVQKMKILDAKMVYVKENDDKHTESSNIKSQISTKFLKYLLFPKKTIFNNYNWGKSFNEIIWNWSTCKSFSAFKNYVKTNYKKFQILNEQICYKEYDIIALIQVRNESKNILEILPHLENYCDGIILLDDESSDNSYDLALHEKLLIKVQKKHVGYFDDLGNRNSLLRLASFFNSKWFFFIDSDERFDPRYGDLRQVISDKENEKFDVYRFNLVDLWNNKNFYRVDMPDRKNDGITTRARMFRNKGNVQIYANREIHFPAVPYSKNILIPKILLLHYGNFDKKTRERKYKLYLNQDADGKKQSHNYEFLKDKEVVLKPLKTLILP